MLAVVDSFSVLVTGEYHVSVTFSWTNTIVNKEFRVCKQARDQSELQTDL